MAPFGLVAMAIALSAWQQLGLETNILVAAGRATIQLAFVGYILTFVFALRNPWMIAILLLVMLTIAAVVARNRISNRLPWLLPMVWGAILVSTALTMAYTTLLVVRPEVWYDPQYIVPLTGIVLGNSMNGAAIAGERLVSSLNSSRLEIETHLSLGATPQQTVAPLIREAVKAGMIQTLNAMLVVGIVTLPGIITGQLLGGADPMQAAAYQLLILFMLAFTTLVTNLLVTRGITRQFFNSADQLVLP
jgi:putative ABC transport system permease protein